MVVSRRFNRNIHSFASFLIAEAYSGHDIQGDNSTVDYVKKQVETLLWDPEYGLLVKKGGDSLPWTPQEKLEYETLMQSNPEEAARFKKNIDAKYRFTPTKYSVKGTHGDVYTYNDSGIPTRVNVKVSRNDYERYKNADTDLWTIPYSGDYKMKSKLLENRPLDVAITLHDAIDDMDEFGNYTLVFDIHTAPVGKFISADLRDAPQAQVPQDQAQEIQNTGISDEFGGTI